VLLVHVRVDVPEAWRVVGSNVQVIPEGAETERYTVFVKP